MSKKIHVTDTILRDAHQSLLATRMRTEDMLPICEKLDKVGYWSLEVWGGATFDACVRFLKEDPWERLRKLRAALPNTRLQMLLRGQNLLGYRHYSDDVVRAFVAKAAVNGIDVFRIFDAMNDVRNLRVAIEAVKASGKHAQGTIAYTTSPVHTIEAFVNQARQMEAMGCDSIAIKDMAGLLTPFATGELVKALKAEQSLPVFIHSHDTAGLAAMCQLKAVENGADHIDTAISNLANQLKEQGALNRMNEVLAEIPRVREDLGFPPLVTPTSQIVGTQAFFNVLAGERYKTITNEVKLYLQGGYGKAPGVVNEQLRRQAIGSEEVIDVRPADLLKPEMTKLRADIGALARCEEDVLTFAMFPDIGRKFLEEREAGTLAPEALLPIPEAGAVSAPGGEGVPTEFVIDVHGETYRVDITGVGVKAEGKRHFYLSIDGMPEEVVFEPLNEFVSGGSSKRKQASAPGHVSTTMPGNIVDVLVKEGDTVKAGQAVLITEAMKMETEVQAAIAGKVVAIHVGKGDRVTPGEILIEIEG